MKTDQEKRSQLLRLLRENFNTSEIEDLCFHLDIDSEGLPGSGKADNTRELIYYCERHQKTTQLIDLCQRARPEVNWDIFPTAAPPVEEEPVELSEDEKRMRRRAELGEDLKYYYYLSETKIDEFHNRFNMVDPSLTKYQKLSIMIERLEQAGMIGTLKEPRDYFKGVLDMKWEVFKKLENDVEVVYFQGRAGGKIVGLVGSPTHILGHARGSPSGSSAAAEQEVYNYILREERKLRRAGDAIQLEENQREDAQMLQDWKSVLTDAIESFETSVRGTMPETVEFVARRFKIPMKGVLLGTPLYVASAPYSAGW